MAKKSKTYDVTFVYDIFHDVDKPISPSMLGKIKKADGVDNVVVKTDRHIVITSIGKMTTSGNPIDEVQGFESIEEKEMENILHACSRFLRIHKIQVFII